MTGEMLSQEEINALLGGMDIPSGDGVPKSDLLTPEETDALGEIGNISMGTAATTLFALLNHKVLITTPYVEVMTLESLKQQITDDLIAVSVGYKEGLTGSNILILNQNDVKIITDLMMGGSGISEEGPITELHLSAIAEAMNQMIGSSATSLSQMFSKRIDISPPEAIQINYTSEQLVKILGSEDPVVKISFRMQVEENIIDSQLMQILPISFAKELVSNLYNQNTDLEYAPVADSTPSNYIGEKENNQGGMDVTPKISELSQPVPMHSNPVQEQRQSHMMRDIEVQKPEFPNFASNSHVYPKENMDVLMDVSLEVSVELGRTHKKIREILEFGPGSVIELDRLVGEAVDVLVNGKFIAKGEVVVIDENFGIRIIDIINPENRI